MDKLLKNQVTKLVPSDELVKSLNQNEYYGAVDILSEIQDEFNIFMDEFSLFDQLNKAINKKDIEDLRLIIGYSEKLFTIDCITEILKYLQDYEAGYVDKNSRYTDYYISLRFYLEKLNNLTSEYIDTKIEELLKKKNKKYHLETSLRSVLSLATESEDDDITVAYVEALIHGNEITYEFFMKCILDDNIDLFLEKFLAVKYLRKLYLSKMQPEIEKLNDSISLIRQIGLK